MGKEKGERKREKVEWSEITIAGSGEGGEKKQQWQPFAKANGNR